MSLSRTRLQPNLLIKHINKQPHAEMVLIPIQKWSVLYVYGIVSLHFLDIPTCTRAWHAQSFMKADSPSAQLDAAPEARRAKQRTPLTSSERPYWLGPRRAQQLIIFDKPWRLASGTTHIRSCKYVTLLYILFLKAYMFIFRKNCDSDHFYRSAVWLCWNISWWKSQMLVWRQWRVGHTTTRHP